MAKKGRVTNIQAAENRAIKEVQMARYEYNRSSEVMWERLLDGEKFESYTMKKEQY
tara:strand:- start:147 stop:314 length:168 start_codon:yes stop_codon:yes gene_type:complete